jgi:hypothetical protein
MSNLQQLLKQSFRQAKTPVIDPDYGRFRRMAAKHQLQYQLTGDGDIEIKACAALPHGITLLHADWTAMLARLKHCIATPEQVETNECCAR